ncbi:MAG: hypothetical protein LBI99_01390 [Propionibacteriaceae bacterium]|nr:hypothetical protein [Propionibacteriaceae bacterium]
MVSIALLAAMAWDMLHLSWMGVDGWRTQSKRLASGTVCAESERLTG